MLRALAYQDLPSAILLPHDQTGYNLFGSMLLYALRHNFWVWH